MPKVALNSVAPDFSLPDYTGKVFTLSEQNGQNVVLVFNRTFM